MLVHLRYINFSLQIYMNEHSAFSKRERGPQISVRRRRRLGLRSIEGVWTVPKGADFVRRGFRKKENTKQDVKKNNVKYHLV